MPENENTTTETTITPEEALAKLMRESVPKDQYDALQKQYNEFFAKVANGSFINEEEAIEPTEEEKQQEFYRAVDNLNNHRCHGSVENMKTLVTIDDYLVSHGERSAFAPSRGEITSDIEKSCEDLNSLMKDAIEQSDGDDALCSAYFARYIDTIYKTGSRS